MRTSWGLILGVGLVCVFQGPVRADEAMDLKKHLEKAGAAIGGEAKIAKLLGMTQKGKGTLHFASTKAPFEETSYWQTPDKFRFDIALDINGNKITEQIVINDKNAWVKINDTTANLPKDLAKSFRDVFYALTLAMRPTDAKGKDYKRAPLGELKINDQDAVGLQISRKGRPDVNIYFAKKTGLPLKCEVRSLDGLEANKEVIHELLMTEYKKFGDLKMFTKLVWNKDGKRYLERELAEVKAEESLDADLFAKP